MKFLISTYQIIKEHLKYWSETYYVMPIFVGLSILFVYLINFWIGRPILESPEFIIGTLYNAVKLCIAAMLTGFFQNALFGYRSNIAGTKLSDDLYDALVTFGLFITILIYLWN